MKSRSALRRVIDRGQRRLNQLYNIEIPPLADGEYVIRDGGAVLSRGFLVGNAGRFVLTTHRLLFMSIQPPPIPLISCVYPRIDVDLGDIVLIDEWRSMRRFGSKYPGFPTLAITLRDGRNVEFQVKDLRDWRIDIDQLRRGEDVRGMQF